MTARCSRAIVAALLATGLIAYSAGPAGAHRYPDYYSVYDEFGVLHTARWSQTMIPWQFGEGYAGSGQHWLDRATDALRTWSDASESRLLFSRVADDETPINDYGECEGSRVDSNGISLIRRGWKYYNVRGWTTLCYDDDGPDANGHWAVTGFVVTITSTPRWTGAYGNYVGSCGWNATLAVPADDQCDLASTITHEVGHAVGHSWHFDDSDPDTPFYDGTVCKPNVGDADAQTMCELAASNSTWRRSLEEHDISTLRNAYANWPPPPAPPPTSTTTTVTTPPSNGGGLPDPHCDTLDQPASGGLFGVPVCV